MRRKEREGKFHGENRHDGSGKIARKWTVSLASTRQSSSIFPPAYRVLSLGSLDRGGLIAAKRGGEEGSR